MRRRLPPLRIYMARCSDEYGSVVRRVHVAGDLLGAFNTNLFWMIAVPTVSDVSRGDHGGAQ